VVDTPQLTVIFYLVFLHFHHSSRVLVGALDGQHTIAQSTHDLDMINGTFNKTLAAVYRGDCGRTDTPAPKWRSLVTFV